MNKEKIKIVAKKLFQKYPQYNGIILGQKVSGNINLGISMVDPFNQVYDDVIGLKTLNTILLYNTEHNTVNDLLELIKNFDMEDYPSCCVQSTYLVFIDKSLDIKMSTEFEML